MSVVATPRRCALLLTLVLLGCSGSGEDPGKEVAQATCPAVEKLAVESSTPVFGQTGVSVKASVTVRFNTCLDEGSVKAASLTLAPAGKEPVPARVSYDAAQRAIVVTPEQALAFSTDYTFAIKAGVKSTKGLALSGHALAFRTRGSFETVPPATGITPNPGLYNTPQTVTLTCVDNPGGTGCVDTHYTLDGSTPTRASPRYLAPLRVEQTLTVRYFSVDGDGNEEPVRTAHYTIDTVSPRVASTQPADGATGVRLDATVTVSFDERMQEATLRDAPTFAPLWNSTYATNATSSSVVRTPSEPLECATTYRVTVPTTARDVAGNGLAAPHVFSFTTTADCEAPRTGASLASGAFAQEQQVTLTCDDGAGGSGCTRLVYTLDGSTPSFSPLNGTVVPGTSAFSLRVGNGETRLRFRSEDAVGHVEVVRERRYSVSTAGFTWVAAGEGLARGVGPEPERFVTLRQPSQTYRFYRDMTAGRFYRLTNPELLFTDDGRHYQALPVPAPANRSTPRVADLVAQGMRLFLATSDGLHVSTDGGEHFRVVDFGSYDANDVRRVVASGTDVYAGTRTALHVSNDAFHSSRAALSGEVTDLAVEGTTVYAVVAGAVRVSRDRGATWEMPSLPAGAAGSVQALAASGDLLYAAVGTGLAVSSDRGATFTSLRTATNGLDGNTLRFLAASDGVVYVGTGVPFSSAPEAFFVSSNAGATFVRRRIPGGTRDVSLQTLLADGADVHVGGYPGYWRSRDHGATFALEGLPWGGASRVTGQGAKVYAAIDDSSGWGAVAISGDHGTTFRYSTQEQGLPASSIDDLFFDGGKLYVATGQGLGISSDDGRSYDVRTQANSNLWSNGSRSLWAVGSTVWSVNGRVQRSTNGGQNFVDVLTGAGPDWVNAELIEVQGANVYLAAPEGLYVSNDSGATFALRGAAHGFPEREYVFDVAVDATGRVYASTLSALYVSTDRGAHFSLLPFPSAVLPTQLSASGTHLYVGHSTLGISSDGGATFVLRGSQQGLPSFGEQVRYLPLP